MMLWFALFFEEKLAMRQNSFGGFFILSNVLMPAAVAAPLFPNEEVQKAKKSLVGSWTVVAAESGERKLTANEKTSLGSYTFDLDKVKITYEKVVFEASYIVNPSTSPKELDIVVVDNGKKVNNKRVMKAIYTLEEGILKIACSLKGPEAKRPDSFTQTEISILTLKQIKK